MNNKFAYLSMLTVTLALLLTCPAWAEDDVSDESEVEKQKKRAEALKEAELQKEIKEEMGIDVSGYYDQLVMVKSKSEFGSLLGSGFLGTMDGNTYLFTPKSLLIGSDEMSFNSASGKTLKPVSIELSKSGDLARLRMSEGEGLVIGKPPYVGLPIAIYGNSEGGGVVTELYGKVELYGAKSIEVSAPFVEGNTGSPVMNAQGAVVAMANRIRYSTKKDSDDEDEEETIVRRYCLRLDNHDWIKISWSSYNKKYGKIYLKHKEGIRDLYSAIHDWTENPYSSRYFGNTKDSDIQEWIEIQKELGELFSRNKRILENPVTSSQLSSMNKKVQYLVADSGQKLLYICNKYEKKMNLLTTVNKDPTGFLQEEFETYAEIFESLAEAVEVAEKKYSRRNVYSFR